MVRLVCCKASNRQYALKTLSKAAMVASDDPKDWKTETDKAKKVITRHIQSTAHGTSWPQNRYRSCIAASANKLLGQAVLA